MSGGGGGRGGRGGGGGGEGRLAKALVDTKTGRVGVSMGFQQLHDPGLVDAVAPASTKDQSLDAAREDAARDAGRRRQESADEEEVDRVKTGMLRGLENSLSDPQAIATGALNTAIAQGDWRLMFLQHDRLKDVTPGGRGARREDVLQAVQPHGRLLHPRRGAGPHGGARRRPISRRRC